MRRPAGSGSTGIAPPVMASGLSMVLTLIASPGWAQGLADPDSVRSDDWVVFILIAAAGFLLVLALAGKILELRLRRDGEAVAVRGLMTDALEREPSLLGLSITIVRVRVPLWTGRPVTVRVAGKVPADQLRRAALQSMRHAAKSNLLVGVRIKARIRVVPSRPASGLGVIVQAFRRIRT